MNIDNWDSVLTSRKIGGIRREAIKIDSPDVRTDTVKIEIVIQHIFLPL